jgi:SulP family sulfate permease
VLLVLRAWAPRVPAALVVVVAGIGLSSAVDLAAHGVAVVGEIPAGLPSVTLPATGLGDVAELAPAALGLFFVCFADAILTARSFAGRHGEHVSVNSELLALGAANAAAGVTQGMAVGASGSRTAVNDAMGVRSQVSGLLAAAAVLGVLVFLTGPIADLPKTVLAAVIIAAAVGLVEPPQWRALWATDRVEFTIAAIAGAGVLLTGVLEAIVFAVGLSILDVVRRSARPHDAVLGWVPQLERWADVAVHPDAGVAPGVVVYRLDDRLFFANTGYVRGRISEALRGAPTEPIALVLDAEAMTHVDTAGLDLLGELPERLAQDGIALHVARAHSALAERLERTGVAERIGRDRFHPTVRAAVDAATTRAVADPG